MPKSAGLDNMPPRVLRAVARAVSNLTALISENAYKTVIS